MEKQQSVQFRQPNIQNNYIVERIKYMSHIMVLSFTVTCQTSLGEEVFICGSLKQLGCWDTDKALKLVTSKQFYPQWKSKMSLFVAPNILIEFKLFIKTAEGTIKWEKVLQNRKYLTKQPVLISCIFSDNEMVIEPIEIKEQSNTRKNTFEIMNDLSDDVSESSSGNQREFWLQRSTRERATISSSREFVSTAKLIFETWGLSCPKPKQKTNINAWLQIVPCIHIIIKKGKGHHMNRKFTIAEEVKSKQNSPTKVSNTTVLQAMSMHQLKSIIYRKQFFEDVLKIVHLQQQEWSAEQLIDIQKMLQGFYVIHLNAVSDEKSYFDSAEIVVIRKKQVLQQFFQIAKRKKCKAITMIKEHQFLIKKQQNQALIVYFEPNLSLYGGQLLSNNDYFSSVEKNLLNNKNLTLPDNLRISIMMEKNILRQVRKNKFCVVILCEKLQQIPQKALASLIRVSSCQNVSINIMTADCIQQIFKKLPVSQKQKILVYNRFSDVFKPFKKPSNIFQQLKLHKNKYEQIFKELSNSIKFWTKADEVKILQTPFSIQFTCDYNTLGETISEHLQSQFAKMNTTPKYPFIIEKYLNFERKKIIVDVRPVLCSSQFYSKTITSISIAPVDNTYFVAFDFTGNRYRFKQKMERTGLQKGGICQGFILQKNYNQKRGLKESKFQQFLTLLLTQSEYSIIQEDLQASLKSKNQALTDGNAIKSEIIK